MNFPRLPLHVGDFLKRTGHLGAAEFGAYTALVCHYWANGHLPPEEKQLAQIARMSIGQWRKCTPTIERLFASDWRLPWLDAELTDARTERERRSKAGKRGNVTRWGKDRHALADKLAFDPPSQSDPDVLAPGSLPHATRHPPPASPPLECPEQDEREEEGQHRDGSKDADDSDVAGGA